MAVNLTCKVHPVVLFSIVDSYERRNEDVKRVIGTLLGIYDKGTVEITNCFAVPHNESEDEVAIDIEFARNMFELHRKVNSTEVIVGWYSTSHDVSEHSVLIHEYYGRECRTPIHLTVDTTLKGNKMGMKAFTSTSVGVAGKTVGNMFTPVPIELTAYDAEKVGVDLVQRAKFSKLRQASMVTDLQKVSASTIQLQDMLHTVMNYVDEVIAGRRSSDNTVGRFLMELVTSVPKLDSQALEEMLNSNMKDLLMIVYLSNLTKTQLLLNEKLSTL